MPRLHCEVSSELNKVMKRAKIRELRTKGRVLKKFITLAINDTGEYAGGLPYGEDKEATATISKFSEEEYQNTVAYRERWGLESQKNFFQFALHHGATLWEQANP